MANKRGFTVIEMVITVFLIGLIVSIALMLSAKMLPRWDLRGFARNFVANIYKARSIALKQERSVTIEFQEDRYLIKTTINGEEKVLEEKLIPDTIQVSGETTNPIMITPEGRFYVLVGGVPQIKLIIFTFSNKHGDQIEIKIFPLGTINLTRKF